MADNNPQQQVGAPRRPLDDLAPPSDPLPFPHPQLVRGRRDTVCVYNPETDGFESVHNVLFRADDGPRSAPRFAYFTDPDRECIKTIMGHVEFCVVLEQWRGTRQQADSDDELDRDDDDDHFANGEMVYQWTSRRVAVKVHYAEKIDLYRGRRAENPMNEIAALQMLGAEPVHVLGAEEVLLDGRHINVIMRFCDGGDFFEMMQAVRDRPDHPDDTPGMTEGEARFWLRQIIKGVVFLHAKGICHHDLSPENIVIDGQEALIIIDLGMCLRVPYQDPRNNGHVTDVQGSLGLTPRCLIRPQGPYGKPPYMSPEVYINRHPFDGAAIDVWSAGIILFSMITGNQSYQRPHRSDQLFLWMTQRLRQLLNSWNVTMSETGIQLLEGMLQTNPRLRLTLEEVSQHAWFEETDDPPGQTPSV